MESKTGLKNLHGLRLALHLPEGKQINRKIFDTLDTDEMKGENGNQSLSYYRQIT